MLDDRWLREYEENIRFDPLHYERERYIRALADRNDLPYWFTQMKDCGFRMPETKIIQMPLELWSEMHRQLDGLQKGFLEKLGRFVEANWDLVPGDLDINGRMFYRSGTCSGKFCMKTNSIVNSKDEIPLRIFNTFYEGECLGKPESVHLVFREFIETSYDRPPIYEGLKLNTEFRIFYDFDRHRFIQGFDYWGDHDPMMEGIPDGEQEGYERTYPVLEEEFGRLLPVLERECDEKLKDVRLRGRWSVDFMWTGAEFVLIDMALMEYSHFADRVEDPVYDRLMLLSTGVRDCDLTVRVVNVLDAYGIRSVRELVKVDGGRMATFRNFGRKSMHELEMFLKEHSLRLGMTEEDISRWVDTGDPYAASP